MGFGGFLKGLFGGGQPASDAPARGEATPYKDYRIAPTPLRQGGQFLTCGVITKDFPDGPKEYRFIRADTHSSSDAAASFAIQKGQQIIDEQGDQIFRQA